MKETLPETKHTPIEDVVEEFMWQTKGDMHNLAGQYVPAFTDKVEKRLRTLLQSQAEEYEGEKRCNKKMPDGSICRCILDCHLHDWRQRDAMGEMVEEIISRIWTVGFNEMNIRAIAKKYGVDLSE